jgi:Cu+-exporting ATPase
MNKEHAAHLHQQATSVSPSDGTVIDPACGMNVRVRETTPRVEHNGTIYYFCNPKCRDKFVADPAHYVRLVTEPAPAPRSAASRTKWTCPMHPEVVRDAPGSCPICGMALEPMTPTAAVGPNPELKDMTRRFWIGLALTLPVVALEMGGHVLTLHQWLGQQTSNWLQLLGGSLWHR